MISMTNMADYGYGLVYDVNTLAPYFCEWLAPRRAVHAYGQLAATPTLRVLPAASP